MLGSVLAVGSLVGANAAPAVTISFSAPFTGYSVPIDSTYSWGCASATTPKPASVSTATGDAKGTARVVITNNTCVSKGTASYATSLVEDGFTLELGNPPKSGAQSVVLYATVDWSDNLSAKAGSSTGYAIADFEVYVAEVYLIDLNNATSFDPLPYTWYASNSVTSGSSSMAGPTNVTFYWNATSLVKAHSYDLDIAFAAYAYIDASGGKAKASATASLGTTKLTRVTWT